MELNDDTWQVVRNTEGVTGFVGTKKKPTPLNPKDLKSILAFTKVKQPTYQTSFSIGDAVKVVDGPFADFVGSISEINQDKGQIKVLLSIFGRETPVVLDFLQVKKL
jgi:transcriptional antiterminator NusG